MTIILKLGPIIVPTFFTVFLLHFAQERYTRSQKNSGWEETRENGGKVGKVSCRNEKKKQRSWRCYLAYLVDVWGGREELRGVSQQVLGLEKDCLRQPTLYLNWTARFVHIQKVLNWWEPKHFDTMPCLWRSIVFFRQRVKEQIARDRAERAEKVRKT